MKKILTYVAALGALICANACYDDSAVNERIDALEDRFDKLEVLVNTDIANLQKLVTSLQGVVTVVSVTPTANGYDVVLSDGTKMTITNGKDGANGKDGVNGTNGKDGKDGKDGADGKDGESTVVGITEIDGVYYWTLDGKLVKDGEGKNIPVSAGAPEFKIEDGDWYVTYDKGLSWVKVAGSNGTALSFFKDVTVTADEVVFTLADGSKFALPILKEFALTIVEDVQYVPTVETVLPYVITGASSATKVFCFADGPFQARVAKVTSYKGDIIINSDAPNGFGQILVFAVDGAKTIVKCISIKKGVVIADVVEAPKAEGIIEIPIVADQEYKVVLSDSWMHLLDTKGAVRRDTIRVSVDKNPYGNPDRVGTITITDMNDILIKEVAFVQEGSGSFMYSTYTAQKIDPSTMIVKYATSTKKSLSDWITVEEDGKISVAANAGIVRKGAVKFGADTLYVIQNPGNAFLDFYFENANGTQANKTYNVTNCGYGNAGGKNWTSNFMAYAGDTSKDYVRPMNVKRDDRVGHKVASFENTVAPSSYGAALWRNINGDSVKSMKDGWSVEAFVSLDWEKWKGSAQYGEANIFAYRVNKAAAGQRAFSLGIYNSTAGKPVFSGVYYNNKRFNANGFVIENSDYNHVVFTYDKTAQRLYLYVNGVKLGEAEETRDMLADVLQYGTVATWWGAEGANLSAGAWCFGAYINNQWCVPASCWNGTIAACRVYNSTLTPEQIAESSEILRSAVQK